MRKKCWLLVMVAFLVSGCSTEYNLATHQEETLMYGTDKEVQIGDSMAAALDKQEKFLPDVDVNERLEGVLNRLIEVVDRKDIIYSIKVIDEDEVNAFALPGGHVYIYKGLVDKLKTDDEIAGVIAHELGHVNARHGIKRLQAQYGFMLLQVLAVGSQKAEVAQGVNALLPTVFVHYSRQDEFEADRLGVKYTQLAGYDCQGMLNVLNVLEKELHDSQLRPKSYFRTHPYIPERMAMINKEIHGSLSFKDYLNVTGNDL